jgi:hypothetical protein
VFQPASATDDSSVRVSVTVAGGAASDAKTTARGAGETRKKK